MEADAGDVVESAAVGAPTHLDVQLVDQGVVQCAVPGGQLLHYGGSQAHGRGNAQLAAIRTRARDHVGDRVGPGVHQAYTPEGLPHVIQIAFRYPAQRQVLLLGGTGPPSRVPSDDVRQHGKLVDVDVPLGQLDLGDTVPCLLLLRRIGPFPTKELRGRSSWPFAPASGGAGGVSLWSSSRCIRGVGSMGPIPLQLLLHKLLEGFETDALDEDLDAGHHPVLAKHLSLVEHPPDRLGHPEVVLLWHKVVEHLASRGMMEVAPPTNTLNPRVVRPLSCLTWAM